MNEIPESEDIEKEKDMREIPVPDDTGSSGTQEVSKLEASEVKKENLLQVFAMTDAVQGLAADKSRSLGGEATGKLLAGSFTQLSYELQQTKCQLNTTQGKLDETKEELSNFKVKSAVLGERVKSLASGRHLKNLSITGGTALVGISFKYYDVFGKLAFIAGGLGVLLILFGWFSRKEGTEE